MAEAAATVETKQEEKQQQPVVAKAGSPVRADLPIQKSVEVKSEDQPPANGIEAKNNTPENKGDGNGTQAAATITPAAGEISEDALKAYLEKQGITYEGMDKLKEKLTVKPVAAAPTDEEKQKAE